MIESTLLQPRYETVEEIIRHALGLMSRGASWKTINYTMLTTFFVTEAGAKLVGHRLPAG